MVRGLRAMLNQRVQSLNGRGTSQCTLSFCCWSHADLPLPDCHFSRQTRNLHLYVKFLYFYVLLRNTDFFNPGTLERGKTYQCATFGYWFVTSDPELNLGPCCRPHHPELLALTQPGCSLCEHILTYNLSSLCSSVSSPCVTCASPLTSPTRQLWIRQWGLRWPAWGLRWFYRLCLWKLMALSKCDLGWLPSKPQEGIYSFG